MPTISQLPRVAQVTPADEIPLSQGGATHSVSVGALLAGTQPAVISASGKLFGRTSLGPGGPEPITVGPGLMLNDGTLFASSADLTNLPQQATMIPTDQVVLNSDGNPRLLPLSLLRGLFSAGANIGINPAGTISSSGAQGAAYSVTNLTPAMTIATDDLVAISQSGTDHTISYANFLDGLTIDLAQPAAGATDTDALWVSQGSNTMLRQSFSAIWSWFTAKLPSYKLPVVEITVNTTLDGTVHNGRILICSQPVTLSPAPLNMGNGFFCDVLNLSSGNVIFGAGITSSSGSSWLLSGQAAAIRCVSYSGGNVVFASLVGSGSSDGTAPAAPGQVISLNASSATTSSLALNWSPPSAGGAVSNYTVQYRIAGATIWSTYVAGLTTINTLVTGLAAGTTYDFQVYAVNGGGAGPASTVANASTTAIAGAVIGITWNMVPSGNYTHGLGSIVVNAHINPGSAAVQFGFSASSTVPPASWTLANYVNTDLWGAYVSTPSFAGTWYAWIEGTDGSKLTVYPTAFTVT